MTRSYYSDTISNFLQEDENTIFGYLSKHHNHDLEALQKNAWIKQIRILKATLRNFETGQIYFEFSIPRMGKRVDNILIINDLIFVLEFKVGDSEYQKHAIDQVIDYCLDLKNFHEASHHAKLIPLLVATKAEAVTNIFESADNLFEVIKANEQNLSDIIALAVKYNAQGDININAWENSIYKPTPTIIEAAQALYKGHNVKEISRHDAGAINLTATTDCITQIIEESKTNNRKSICFLTGVPGAGKTLAGLNIANTRQKIAEDEHAVFLSGNGPLVEVLREALTRDKISSAKVNAEKITRKSAEQATHKFIQNIHHFRDEYLISSAPPIEKVVIFDEAQRAWAMEQVSAFMKRKKGVDDFNMSEPQFLISVMDRHTDWCTIVCLIGGGQEINTGEAGVSEWLSALKNNYRNWDIHFSSLILTDDNYLSDEHLRAWLKNNGTAEDELHLSVSVRSFRSEKVSELVREILDCQTSTAKALLNEIKSDFPVFLTRDLDTAKRWLRSKAKGTERTGLIASSGARRLRPLGIDVKNDIEAPNWFLNTSDDIRSSYYLEEVATEFDIQGLEIDWVCLAWDINFYFKHGEWHYRSFEGTKWHQIHKASARTYLQNTYRVLLTRARQGIIIYVPVGDDTDITRPKELYEDMADYLIACGIPKI